MANDQDMASATDLARRIERSLFGKYRAVVYDNVDPEKRGRLRLLVPSVFGAEPTDWVAGAFPLASDGNEAFIMVPEVNSHVLVEFIEGDKSAPIWTAAYYPDKPNKVPVPAEFDLDQGRLHLLRTRSGIAIRLEDDGASEQVIVIAHPGGGELRVDKDGIVTIKDQGGAQVMLDPQGSVTTLKGHGDGELRMDGSATTLSHGGVKLELTSAGITATAPLVALDGDNVTLGKGAASPVLDGQAFAGLFDGHTNPQSAITPTPLSPVLMAMSLKKVKGA